MRIAAAGPDNITIELTLINKTSTRFAEAAFFTFAPLQTEAGPSNPGSGWAIDKLGEWVSPLAVADGGSQGMSPVTTGMLYARGDGGARSTRARTTSNTTTTMRGHREQGGGSGGADNTSSGGAVFFRTLDSAVVKFGPKLPFPTPIHGGANMSAGIHYLLWDNFWNTNYVFWWQGFDLLFLLDEGDTPAGYSARGCKCGLRPSVRAVMCITIAKLARACVGGGGGVDLPSLAVPCAHAPLQPAHRYAQLMTSRRMQAVFYQAGREPRQHPLSVRNRIVLIIKANTHGWPQPHSSQHY